MIPFSCIIGTFLNPDIRQSTPLAEVGPEQPAQLTSQNTLQERNGESNRLAGAALPADTARQLLVPQIRRMPGCLPTVLGNSWAGA